jgi:hypothetical protein
MKNTIPWSTTGDLGGSVGVTGGATEIMRKQKYM